MHDRILDVFVVICSVCSDDESISKIWDQPPLFVTCSFVYIFHYLMYITIDSFV